MAPLLVIKGQKAVPHQTGSAALSITSCTINAPILSPNRIFQNLTYPVPPSQTPNKNLPQKPKH